MAKGTSGNRPNCWHPWKTLEWMEIGSRMLQMSCDRMWWLQNNLQKTCCVWNHSDLCCHAYWSFYTEWHLNLIDEGNGAYTAAMRRCNLFHGEKALLHRSPKVLEWKFLSVSQSSQVRGVPKLWLRCSGMNNHRLGEERIWLLERQVAVSWKCSGVVVSQCIFE